MSQNGVKLLHITRKRSGLTAAMPLSTRSWSSAFSAFQEVHGLLGPAHQAQRQQHAAEAFGGHGRRDMGDEIVDLEG